MIDDAYYYYDCTKHRKGSNIWFASGAQRRFHRHLDLCVARQWNVGPWTMTTSLPAISACPVCPTTTSSRLKPLTACSPTTTRFRSAARAGAGAGARAFGRERLARLIRSGRQRAPFSFVRITFPQVPHFNGKAYLELRRLQAYQGLSLEIEFKAYSSDGLLLYNGQTMTGAGDFLSLALRDGHVEFRYNLGSGERASGVSFYFFIFRFFVLFWRGVDRQRIMHVVSAAKVERKHKVSLFRTSYHTLFAGVF